MEKTRLVFQAGVLALAVVYAMFALMGVGLAQTNSTTTTTTTDVNWAIDVTPLINIVIALLPAVLAIGIIKMMFESLGKFSKFTKLADKFPRVNINPRLLASVAFIAMVVAGIIFSTPIALAQTDSGFDVSGMVELVMSLMPLIIILVIMKALMSAFSGLAK